MQPSESGRAAKRMYVIHEFELSIFQSRYMWCMLVAEVRPGRCIVNVMVKVHIKTDVALKADGISETRCYTVHHFGGADILVGFWEEQSLFIGNLPQG